MSEYKVMQDKFGFGGNCQSATVATILGLRLDEVPSFWIGCDIEDPESQENGIIFNKNLDNFLNKYGFTTITLGTDGDDNSVWVSEISNKLAGVKLLVNGYSPRGHMHSVIWMDGKLWHDPHPDNTGVIPANITFLVPLLNVSSPAGLSS